MQQYCVLIKKNFTKHTIRHSKYMLNFWTNLDPSLPQYVSFCVIFEKPSSLNSY